MTDMSGEGVRVLVIASSARDGSVLAIARSAHDLSAALTQRLGVNPGVVLDPPDVRTMAAVIGEEARQAVSVLWVHFVGYAVIGTGGRLCLAAADTGDPLPDLTEYQALSVGSLSQALAAGGAATVLVTLDCFLPPDSAATAEAAHGPYVITSAGPLTLAPNGAHTAFTGALIDLFLRGDPAAPHLLTPDAVYDAMFRAMREQNLPLPRRQAGGNVVLATNPAVPFDAPPPPEPAPDRCPYPGLRPFGIADAGLFFGRQEMTERLLARLGDTPLTLVGPAGSGKTSLLHAGLLPALPEPHVCLTPGANPLRALGAVAGQPIVVVDQLEELFTRCTDPHERAEFVQKITTVPDCRVVLALRADFYAQAAAFPELRTALRDNQVLVEPMTQDELRAAIEGPAELEPRLTEAILAEAAELPALAHALRATWQRREGDRLTVAGYRAAGGVENAIATSAEQAYGELDAAGQAAVRRILPRLVQVGDQGPDTARPVELAALLDDAAEPVIDRFTEAGLLTVDGDTVRVAHEVLPRHWPRLAEWVDADRDWRHARRRLAADAEAWERADRDPSLLYKGNRLKATAHRAAESADAELEPGSAALMDASWRRDRRDHGRRRLVVAALAVLALLAPIALVGAAAFHAEAARAEDSDLARHLAAQAETLRSKHPGLAKQLSLLSYRINPGVGRDAVLASQRSPGTIDDGETVKDIVPDADGQVLALPTGDGITLRGHGASGRIGGLRSGPTAISGDGTLLAAFDSTDPQKGSGVLRLWTITDLAHPRPRVALPVPATVTSLAVTPDGNTLFAGLNSGDILALDIVNRDAPKVLPPLKVHTAAVDSIAVSPKRGLMASTSVDGVLQLWDVSDPARPAQLRKGTVVPFDSDAGGHPLHRAAFDRTGMFLAIPGKPDADTPATGFPSVWKMDDPRAPVRIPYASEVSDIAPHVDSCLDKMTSVAFSPRSGHVVAVCDKKWHMLRYRTSPDFGSTDAETSSDRMDIPAGAAVFSPKGDQVLQATDTGVTVSDVAEPDQPGAKGLVPEIPGTGGQLAYRAAGKKQLIAMQGVGVTTIWDVTDPSAPTRTAAIPAPDLFTANGIALSSDGRLLAAPELYPDGQHYGVALRRTSSPGGSAVGTIDVLDNGIGALAFSPTKPILAVSDINGLAAGNVAPNSVRLYNVADPGHPKQIAQLPVEAWSFAFSPDGATFTVSVLENDPGKTGAATWMDLRGYDVSDPAHPRQLWQQRLPSGVHADFAYSPDGSVLAVFDSTGTLRLWHVDQHRPVGTPTQVGIGEQPGYGPLAFSPDGKQLALIASFANGTDTLERPEMWDVSNPDSPTRQFYLPAESFGFYALAISPDGRTLAISRASAGVDLWDTDPAHLVTEICASVGDPISRQQWDQYLPGRDYQPPCG
ncbi:hypothetical protein [Kutzneria buriramensis]|uniref:WD40 repeat protein n=1 Tax=Kutzneria buriramensis TaxID=1045776 RepID=A0A3E0H6S7_9PSEU|nr:hypothetical protein [Kutzneria buriramensis]REH39160.1 WD40 repeat protein [Kutzneria buriramensis]